MAETFSIKNKATSVKNPQANSILEEVNQLFMRMMHTSKHNMHCEPVTINERLSNVNWAICSTYIPYIPNLVLRQV